MTLEEELAGEIAQLLIEAAEARHQAATSAQQQIPADLLTYASELENNGIKWERRLGWWKRLQDQSKRPKS